MRFFTPKEELERIERVERINMRMHEAYRWLSEFDPILSPLWKFVFGEKVTYQDGKGNQLSVLSHGDISQVRDKIREALKK